MQPKAAKLGYVEACAAGRWRLELWKKEGGDGEVTAVPFRCRSWRHEGKCRLWCGACDFRRVSAAISANTHWTYLVLTYPAKKWPIARELYRFGVISWARLRKQFVYHYGEIKYIQTWEMHRSGLPHVNVLVSNESFHQAAILRRRETKIGWLEPACLKAGFGAISWLEPMRSSVRMAGYLTKLARELTGAAVKDQTPVNAPRHFRRIRASVRLLPPRHKSDEYTGRIVKLPVQDQDLIDTLTRVKENRLSESEKELNARSTDKGNQEWHWQETQQKSFWI